MVATSRSAFGKSNKMAQLKSLIFFAVPTSVWRSAMTLPREINLIKVSGKYELKFSPARELKSILGATNQFKDSASANCNGFKVSYSVDGQTELKLSNNAGDFVNIAVTDHQLTFDHTHSGIVDFNSTFPAIHNVDTGDVEISSVDIFVDQASVELFVNAGERVMTEIVFPTKPFDKVSLTGTSNEFSVTEIKSIF